ncbi:dTDP-4-dehydrorhamnose reductase [Alicyclobacillus sp. SO9]|uniref:dTDP-4-dehydrorhamnose reductase n=1 Tax=Alicyclobacillus sp. SO9 TaxID=2665646 RepID=UPI0018E8DD35|nr:dTDP-4-dehydrorhamnose reductase [Alicyclobacillus sp. SO9]QQE79199.1 dTDP-4-dehydrorhamnose reductase [Alicyclobacillus sp. SO9]
MKALVTGARGQLGRDVVSLFSHYHDTFGFGRDQLDITDADTVRKIIREMEPDVVIHTAAYTAVDRAEEDKHQAFVVNAQGSQNVAAAAAEVGAKLCAISTDYVFDGQASTPYTEDSKVNPQSVYGQSKLAGEDYVREITDSHFIVRTSWVFGVHGNNFVKTLLKLGKQGKPLKVVNDQFGSPTSTADLAKLLLELVASNRFGTYHASNTGVCSWYDFSREIFRQAGIQVEVEPCTTEEFSRPAPRPAYSVLAHDALRENGFHLLQPWQDALRDFLGDWSHYEDLEGTK